jgi:hypothetical protein
MIQRIFDTVNSFIAAAISLSGGKVLLAIIFIWALCLFAPFLGPTVHNCPGAKYAGQLCTKI